MSTPLQSFAAIRPLLAAAGADIRGVPVSLPWERIFKVRRALSQMSDYPALRALPGPARAVPPLLQSAGSPGHPVHDGSRSDRLPRASGWTVGLAVHLERLSIYTFELDTGEACQLSNGNSQPPSRPTYVSPRISSRQPGAGTCMEALQTFPDRCAAVTTPPGRLLRHLKDIPEPFPEKQAFARR